MLKEIKHIGFSYYHRFKQGDGSLIDVETTKEDYEQLGGSNPQNPSLPGAVWVNSGSKFKFDTVDGSIGDNEWADIGGKYKCVKLAGYPAVTIDNLEVSDINDPKVMDISIDTKKIIGSK